MTAAVMPTPGYASIGSGRTEYPANPNPPARQHAALTEGLTQAVGSPQAPDPASFVPTQRTEVVDVPAMELLPFASYSVPPPTAANSYST